MYGWPQEAVNFQVVVGSDERIDRLKKLNDKNSITTGHQARAEGGLWVLEHLPIFPLMPKVPFCQAIFFFL